VSGADINAHLAIAAVLACGHWGIRNKKEIPVAPYGQEDSDRAAASGERLARTLQEATERMSQPDSVARQVLGDSFVDHYVKVKEHEWRLWQTSVTDFETRRYLELI
jgi:glutamine synthetase